VYLPVVRLPGNIVEIDEIDAFADTPILDIKPYIPDDDSAKASVPDWLKNLKSSLE
jgi:tRNA (Thr-GGU) A37 N-methylase